MEDQKDKYIKDLLSRAEKLSAGVYLVTSFLGEQEPLKWSLREKMVTLQGVIVRLNLVLVRDTVREVISLFETASSSGLVSDMNQRILKEQFLRFLELADKISVPGNLLKEPEDKGRVEPVVRYALPENPQQVSFMDKSLKDKRRDAILGVIRRKGQVGIKDISKAVKGCSEKTIQRELINLVSEGVLKKEGERRWSRYSIIER